MKGFEMPRTDMLLETKGDESWVLGWPSWNCRRGSPSENKTKQNNKKTQMQRKKTMFKL